ncbi:MAG TPA: molybdenum cofactor guanylyltransferase [Candidatus Limnocylindrales bacterium]
MTESSAPLEISGIVLAGGRSRRFGSDKLVARVGDERLLDRAIAALGIVTSEVVVVLAPGDERSFPPIDPRLRVVHDLERHGGPLVGLLTGLTSVAQPLVLVVGGDMPLLRPGVLRLLARRLELDAGVGAVVLRARGALVPLPAAVRTGAATDVAQRLVADGERRLRSLFERLPTRILDDAEWRPLDPEGETLRDIDRPEDLPTA